MVRSSGRLRRLQKSFEASVKTTSAHLVRNEQTVMGVLRLLMFRIVACCFLTKMCSQSAKSTRSSRTMISQQIAGLQLNNSHMALRLRVAYGLISRGNSRY